MNYKNYKIFIIVSHKIQDIDFGKISKINDIAL